MHYAKFKAMVAVLACCLGLGVGLHQLGPGLATPRDKNPCAESRPPAGTPEVEPIDPNLVFDEEVQKELKLSANQIRRLSEARDKGTQAAADQVKKVGDIDQRIAKLQQEIERLQKEKDAADQAVHKAQADQVRAAIPSVLSRDAATRLREMTLQRMRLTDVLLDAKLRARLGLDDEQVKKIQELAEKGGKPEALRLRAAVVTTHVRFDRTLVAEDLLKVVLSTDGLDDTSRAELLKVLSSEQRRTLERLSGVKFDK